MGKIRHKLEEAVNKLRQITLPEHEASEKEMDQKNAQIYQDVYQILDEHIQSELEEEKDVDALINALQNYRKHLKFARIVLDKDFTSKVLGEHDVELDSGARPDYKHDLINAERQINLAFRELDTIKRQLKRLTDEEKLKLE